MCWVLRSTVPEVGILSQRLCGDAIHLNNVELKKQIIKQQLGEEPSPQRRQLKYKARSRVLLTNFEVFGKVFKQSLSFCYMFSIRTKTKKKQKNKIIERDAKNVRYSNIVMVMIYHV